MTDQTHNPARVAALDELRRAALDVYGEERASSSVVHAALEAAATALWRVMAEPLDPLDAEPDSL